MQTKEDLDAKVFYSFRADANALGGLLEQPERKIIPTVAPVSLPSVGGETTARSAAFDFDTLVRCQSAYSRVIGREVEGGAIVIVSTAVIEGLNILEVIEADRIVAQLSISVSSDRKLTVSTAGSRFEGLRLCGHRWEPRYSNKLRAAEWGQNGNGVAAALSDVYEIGKAQAANVTATYAKRYNKKWAKNRTDWASGNKTTRAGCSIVEGFESDEDPNKPYGHIVEICGFGRVILGELLLTPGSAQLVSIRAELGCAVTGKISVNCAGGGGRDDN